MVVLNEVYVKMLFLKESCQLLLLYVVILISFWSLNCILVILFNKELVYLTMYCCRIGF